MLKVAIANSSGSYDVSQLIDTLTISGEYRSCARTCDFGLLSSPDDARLPLIDCGIGSAVVVTLDGKVAFSGFVFDRTKSTAAVTINVSCVDRGIYLNRNSTSKSFTGTPEAAVSALCREFGITTGSVAATGVVVRGKFVNFPLYDILATLYTEAAKTTGAAYHIGFAGEKLTIREKGGGSRVPLLRGGSNLMSAVVEESGRSIVNRVLIIDESGNTVHDLRNSQSITVYGQMQQLLRQRAGDNLLGEGKKLLGAGGVEQKITAECLGDIRCITGGAVMLEEAYTGLYGLFYIDADTHTWKNGLYFNKLTLNLQAVMNEKSAGELLAAPPAQVAAAVQGIIKAQKPLPHNVKE